MDTTFLIIIHILICVALVGFILIQQSRGADMGAAFGSGASSTVFGSQGSASFLTHVTSALAAAFFVTSLILAYFAIQQAEPTSVAESLAVQQQSANESGAGNGETGNNSSLPPVNESANVSTVTDTDMPNIPMD